MSENEEKYWTWRNVWKTNGKSTVISLPEKIANALNCKEGHPLKMTLDGEKCILENLLDVIEKNPYITANKTDEEIHFVKAAPGIQSENSDTSNSEEE